MLIFEISVPTDMNLNSDLASPSPFWQHTVV